MLHLVAREEEVSGRGVDLMQKAVTIGSTEVTRASLGFGAILYGVIDRSRL